MERTSRPMESSVHARALASRKIEITNRSCRSIGITYDVECKIAKANAAILRLFLENQRGDQKSGDDKGCSSFRFSNFWVRGASRVRKPLRLFFLPNDFQLGARAGPG